MHSIPSMRITSRNTLEEEDDRHHLIKLVGLESPSTWLCFHVDWGFVAISLRNKLHYLRKATKIDLAWCINKLFQKPSSFINTMVTMSPALLLSSSILHLIILKSSRPTFLRILTLLRGNIGHQFVQCQNSK